MDSKLSIFHKFGRNKTYYEKGTHPDIYRDELRDRLKDVTYVNQTIKIEDKTKRIPVYAQFWGGLPEAIELPWNYPECHRPSASDCCPCRDDRRDEQCDAICFTMNTRYEPSDSRHHIRFRSSNSTVYSPICNKPLNLPTKLGSYFYNVQLATIRPDNEFIHSVKQALISALPRLRQSQIKMNALSFITSQINMKFVAPDTRDGIIRIMATIIKQQDDFCYASVENGLLPLTEGLRILMSLAIGAGRKLQVLNIWNLFYFNQLPIATINDDFHILNEFDYDPEMDQIPPPSETAAIWNSFIDRANYKTLSLITSDLYVKYAWLSLETLHTLYINYSYLSKGQGVRLLQLSCIRNGTLVNLHLLCTVSDLPAYTRQYISFKAWKKALEYCPNLKLYLYQLGWSHYEEFKTIATSNMPLESIQILDGFPVDDPYRPSLFNCITLTLTRRYHSTLKHICIELWRPFLNIDVALVHLLKKLPLLETLEYRGQLDCVDTIFRIVQFLFEYKTLRISRIVLLLQDDPCNPKMFEDVLKHINDTFQVPLMSMRGVDFHVRPSKL